MRSRFRKDIAILETTTTTTQESETSIATNGDSFDSDNGENKSDSSDDESSNNEGNDKSDATFKSLSSSSPTVVHSRRSWIKDFLIFKEQKYLPCHLRLRHLPGHYETNPNSNKKINNYNLDQEL